MWAYSSLLSPEILAAIKQEGATYSGDPSSPYPYVLNEAYMPSPLSNLDPSEGVVDWGGSPPQPYTTPNALNEAYIPPVTPEQVGKDSWARVLTDERPEASLWGGKYYLTPEERANVERALQINAAHGNYIDPNKVPMWVIPAYLDPNYQYAQPDDDDFIGDLIPLVLGAAAIYAGGAALGAWGGGAAAGTTATAGTGALEAAGAFGGEAFGAAANAAGAYGGTVAPNIAATGAASIGMGEFAGMPTAQELAMGDFAGWNPVTDAAYTSPATSLPTASPGVLPEQAPAPVESITPKPVEPPGLVDKIINWGAGQVASTAVRSALAPDLPEVAAQAKAPFGFYEGLPWSTRASGAPGLTRLSTGMPVFGGGLRAPGLVNRRFG